MFACMRCLWCVWVCLHFSLWKEQELLTTQKQPAQPAPRFSLLKVIVYSQEAESLGERADGKPAAGAELDEPPSSRLGKQGSARRSDGSKQTGVSWKVLPLDKSKSVQCDHQHEQQITPPGQNTNPSDYPNISKRENKNLLLTKRQLINVRRTMELDNHHVATIRVII